MKDFHNEFAGARGIKQVANCHMELLQRLPFSIPGISIEYVLNKVGIYISDKPKTVEATVKPYPKLEFSQQRPAQISQEGASWRISDSQFARYSSVESSCCFCLDIISYVSY